MDARPDSDALAAMRLSVFDWSVCALAGAAEPVARVLAGRARDEGGTAQASVVGQRARVPARMAALANGTIGHALDYDDTHFAHIGHPSATVVPAALAAAELAGADGEAMLGAALVGAEASVRVGIWLGRGHYQAGFHQTATAGAFGVALSATRLLGLDAGQTRHALGIVATSASGLKAQFGTMGKPLNAGLAAANGVEAALLAQAGLVSNPAALDGAQGFAGTHAGQGNMAAIADLGAHWLMQDVSYKFHACCHGLHAMLEALGAIAADVPPDRVKSLVIACHPRWREVCHKPEPQDGLECKFSFRHTAAMVLAGVDTAALGSFSDARAHEPGLLRLRDLVEVEFRDDLSETEASVRLHLDDGAVLDARHDLSATRPRHETARKLKGKAAALLGARRAEALWRAVQGGPDLTGLLAVLTSPSAQET